jgi:UDP-N-acetylglucosamine 2-epimerase (non-hydrolysing)
MGTRPEVIKLAPVVAALRASADLACSVIATGQHKQMFRQAADELGVREDADLNVMRPDQTLAGLTARLMTAIDRRLDESRPDMALVQGDTTTVLVASLACFYRRIPVGQVEAGLRTGNIWSPFPEEANRRLATPLVSLHFAPTDAARRALVREGVPESTIAVTGNTVIDALLDEVARQQSDRALGRSLDERLGRVLGRDWHAHPLVLITGHRRENFGEGIEQICRAIDALARRFPHHRFVYPVHMNPNVAVHVKRLLDKLWNVRLIEPQGYKSFVRLLFRCRLVLTDSGGVQEEAPSLGKPVLVMRDTTERPEGVEAGTALLTGADASAIVEHATRLLQDRAAYEAMAKARNPYGDGHAAERIVKRIREDLALGEFCAREASLERLQTRVPHDAHERPHEDENHHNPLGAPKCAARRTARGQVNRHRHAHDEDREKNQLGHGACLSSRPRRTGRGCARPNAPARREPHGDRVTHRQ